MLKYNISIDPSKIKDRWALAALCLLVWLFVAYVVLKNPNQELIIPLTVMILTLLLITLMLMLSFKDTSKLKKPQSTAKPGGRQRKQEPPPRTDDKLKDEILKVGILIKMAKDPQIKEMIKDIELVQEGD